MNILLIVLHLSVITLRDELTIFSHMCVSNGQFLTWQFMRDLCQVSDAGGTFVINLVIENKTKEGKTNNVEFINEMIQIFMRF